MAAIRSLFIFFALLPFLVTVEVEGKPAKREPTRKLNSTMPLPDNWRELLTGNQIDIHIITHTHDDVGWLSTVDQYYLDEVQWILDTMITALLQNSERRFSYVEIAYFYRWWQVQSDATKASVRQLVQNGQLEFNLAGWCMNDEANPLYTQEIDQMTLGMQFIQHELGANVVGAGWHVDPFGHSSATPSMWAQMGMSAFGLNRIDFRLKEELFEEQLLEFVWRSSSSLGEETDMWVSILPYHYCTPGECGYDGGLIINTDSSLPTYPTNFQSQGDAFVAMARQRSSLFRHNQVLIPFGCDFAHQNAFISMNQMDQLIAYVNSNPSYNATVKYSTFYEYAKAVNALNITWPVRTAEQNDFYPYADHPHSYWTGYFTSRPASKQFIRNVSSTLRASEQLFTFSLAHDVPVDPTESQTLIDVLRQAQGVTQHHDAVSGTEKQAVTYDYNEQLAQGMAAVTQFLEGVAGYFLLPEGSGAPPTLSLDPTSINTLSGSNVLPLTVYNSLGWARHDFVSFPLNRSDVIVLDENGNLIASQINPVAPFDVGPSYTSLYNLFFLADLPPVGMRTYFLQVDASRAIVGAHSSNPYIANQALNVSFDANGFLSSITNNRLQQTVSVQHEYWQYQSAFQSEQNSGAYVFRPEQDGRSGVGSNNGPNPSLSVQWKFIEQYPSGHNLVAFYTALASDSYNDTFSAVTRTIDNTQFTYTVARADNEWPSSSPWGQGISMEFLVVDTSNNPPYYPGFFVGSASISGGQTNYVVVSINFTQSFSTIPSLLATVRCSEDVSDFFVVSAFDVTSTGANFNVTRLLSTAEWSQNLFIDWMAWDASSAAALPSNTTAQSAVGTLTYGGENARLTFPIAGPSGSIPADDPVVVAFVETLSVSSAVAITVVDSDPNSVTFNLVCSGGCVFEAGQQIRVSWIASTRKYYSYPIDPPTTQNSYIVGPYVQEAWQTYQENYAGLLYRVYIDPQGASNDTSFAFVETLHNIGPLDPGRELVTRFVTSLNTYLNSTSGVFYTEDNGLEVQQRIYNTMKEEPIAANYYPVAQRAYLQDNSGDMQFTLLSTNAHGCGSFMVGQIEMMLHRRCLADDGFGVGEVLNEQDSVQLKIWMIVDAPEENALINRVQGVLRENPPTLFYGAPVSSVSSWVSKYVSQYSELKQPLPLNIHLLSLNTFNVTAATVFRLQHIFAAGENPSYAVPVSVDLQSVFLTYNISNIVESNLGATLPLSQVNRLQWNTVDSVKKSKDVPAAEKKDADTVVQISPRQLRTFIVMNGDN